VVVSVIADVCVEGFSTVVVRHLVPFMFFHAAGYCLVLVQRGRGSVWTLMRVQVVLNSIRPNTR
jgi:hypothetical protein